LALQLKSLKNFVLPFALKSGAEFLTVACEQVVLEQVGVKTLDSPSALTTTVSH
jgi:hypothetical protein